VHIGVADANDDDVGTYAAPGGLAPMDVDGGEDCVRRDGMADDVLKSHADVHMSVVMHVHEERAVGAVGAA